ncbi:MAG TPA: trigger factor [Leptolinea sp.]
MKLETKPRDDHQVNIIAEFENSDLEAYMHKAARQISVKTKIPGFRPGKAPYAVVLRNYGDEAIREQAIEILVDDKYPQILDEAKIEASGSGKLEDVLSMDPPKLSFTIPLAPVVTIGDLKSINQDYVEPVTSDEQVDKAIRTILANYATPTDVEREAKEGDVVNMELSASFLKPVEGEDKEFISKTPHQAIIGENDMHKETWPFEDFSKNVIGMKAGETKTFKHKFAKDDRIEKLQGRELEFTVLLKGVQEIVLPELNDEFVMKIGQFQSVDTFRDYMRRRLEADSKAEYDSQYYDDLLDKMVELCSFKYAPHMLEEETHSVLHSLQDTLAQQQMDLETYLKVRKLSMEELEEKELKPVAVKRLERSLLVTEISKTEKFELTDDELENSFNQTVNEISQSIDAKQIRKNFNDKKFSQAVAFEAANRAMNRKVLDYLRGLASGAPSAEKPEEKAAEGAAKPKKPRAKKVVVDAPEAPAAE